MLQTVVRRCVSTKTPYDTASAAMVQAGFDPVDKETKPAVSLRGAAGFE